MKRLLNIKKSAFTLMEIAIVILIISILVMLTIPIVNKQMQKSDEYSYFLAYKTVEKLGSQIVAYGDPEIASNNTFEFKIALLNDKLKQTFNKITNSFTPSVKAHSEFGSWSDYEYNIARLCFVEGFSEEGPDTNIGGVIQQNSGSSVTTYSYNKLLYNWMAYLGKDLGSGPAGYKHVATDGYPGPTYNHDYYHRARDICYLMFGADPTDTFVPYDREYAFKRFTGKTSCSGLTKDTMVNTYFKSNSAESFCTAINNNCDVHTEWVEVMPTNKKNNEQNFEYHECVIMQKEIASPSTGNYLIKSSNSKDLNYCTNLGYKNATLSSDKCVCQVGKSASLNDYKVCCSPSLGKKTYSYKKDDGSYECVYLDCPPTKYNEETHSCCSEHGKYSKSLKKCICDDGFITNDNGVNCQKSDVCQTGTHPDPDNEGECVANSPILKASKFCELINKMWNTNDAKCDTFTTENGISYNKTLFNNVTVGTHYLAINSKPGVFNQMDPNIVFSNGLKLWILGDKMASIPGLSFTPVDYDGETNVCKRVSNVYNKAACKDTSDSAYYCSDENYCYDIKTDKTENKKYLHLDDARNCCASLSMNDIIAEYNQRGYLRDARAYAINGFTIFVDINGNKGDGTLWRDVFPFYVSANGNVYAGYPLDAPKGSNALYTGGNSSYLTADVYYFEADSNKRVRKYAYSSIPFAQAQCFGRNISAYTPYCLNLGEHIKGVNLNENELMSDYIMSDRNPCFKNRCFIHVKNKLKFL